MKAYLLTALLCLFATQAKAVILDDTEKLKGQYVVDAGELKRYSCPTFGNYDCLLWPSDLYKVNSQCLTLSSFYSFTNPAALLTVDTTRTISVFVVDRMSSTNTIKRLNAALMDCPKVEY